MFAYAANNPVKYTDPDGNQSMYLPGGGTNFNGPCPGLKYNMEIYSKNNETVGDFVEGITSNSKALAVLIDKVFLGKKFEKEAKETYRDITIEFIKLKLDAKNSGDFDSDNNGKYSKNEAKNFAKYVNDTMLLNYSDKKEIGPYSIDIPKITDKEAEDFLNFDIENYSVFLIKNYSKSEEEIN